jgi:hypothetical protein
MLLTLEVKLWILHNRQKNYKYILKYKSLSQNNKNDITVTYIKLSRAIQSFLTVLTAMIPELVIHTDKILL